VEKLKEQRKAEKKNKQRIVGKERNNGMKNKLKDNPPVNQGGGRKR
jgi:hypothetical protein